MSSEKKPTWRYTQVLYDVIDYYGISVSDFQVFDYIRRTSQWVNAGGWCSDSYETIALELRISPATVKRAIAEGSRLEIIVKHHIVSQQKKTSPEFAELCDKGVPEGGWVKMTQGGSPQIPGQNDPENSKTLGHFDPPTNISNNILNNLSPVGGERVPVSVAEAKEQKQEKTYSPEYETLWLAYERKGNKQEGWKVFDKMTGSEKQKALTAIPYYANEQPDKKFRKDIERYLKSKHYEGILERLKPQTPNQEKQEPASTEQNPHREFLLRYDFPRNYHPVDNPSVGNRGFSNLVGIFLKQGYRRPDAIQMARTILSEEFKVDLELVQSPI